MTPYPHKLPKARKTFKYCSNCSTVSTFPYIGDTDLERLLRYLLDAEGELVGFPALSARVQYLKTTKEGRVEMSDLVEQYALEMAEEVAEASKAEGILRSLKNLIANLG